jgi:hypothetical protein
MDWFVMRRLLFELRMKTWPLRTAIMNISWIPLWWLRKYVPKTSLSWTPAATIRQMAKTIERLEQNNKDTFAGWRRTEDEFREYRRKIASETFSPEAKAIAKDMFGVDFDRPGSSA